MGDVALAPLPLDRDAALALIGRLKGAPVLGAWRGMPEADTEALAELMVKLSQFARTTPTTSPRSISIR